MTNNIPTKQRLLITFGKRGALVYTSNLDVAKIWERVLRRANLPLLYSEGFNPHPRIAVVTALPLGISSECELVDIALREVIPLEAVLERLQLASPPGLHMISLREIPVWSSSLTPLVRSAMYRIQLDETLDRVQLQARITAVLASDQFEQQRERKGRQVVMNVRDFIYHLGLDPDGHLLAHLAVGERGNLRPDEVLQALGLSDQTLSIHRYQLHIERE